MDKLKEIFSSGSPNLRTLPVLHSTEAAYLLQILKNAELQTSKCDVFNEDYLYTFYGIPSYRVAKVLPTGNPGFFPVCFVIAYDKIPAFDRLFPFDTGAFKKIEDIKIDHFHTTTDLDSLELNPNLDDAKKLIEHFYATNENYLSHRPVKTVNDIDSSKYNAWGYTSLINDKSTTKYDNRVATIEMIHKSSIKLTSDNLIQIILPAAFMDNSEINFAIKDVYKIKEPITYETIKGNPREYFGIIYNDYMRFIRANKLM